MGEDGFIIFGAKVVLFYEIIGGAFNAPRQLTYIFDPTGNRVKDLRPNLNLSQRCMYLNPKKKQFKILTTRLIDHSSVFCDECVYTLRWKW